MARMEKKAEDSVVWRGTAGGRCSARNFRQTRRGYAHERTKRLQRL